MFTRTSNFLERTWRKIRLWGIRSSLRRSKPEQCKRFNLLKNGFPSLYRELRRADTGKFINPKWEKVNATVEKEFSPHPPLSFLRNRTIRHSMNPTGAGKWPHKELAFLEEKFPREKLSSLLIEDPVGDPILYDPIYRTSHNSIHQLYHLARFLDRTHANLEGIQTVVEWGGGYGCLAKLFMRLKSFDSTYIIIDTPFWGLSESSRYSQDFVASNQWFNSKHLLLSYRVKDAPFPDSARLGQLAQEAAAIVEGMEFLPGNYYAFH